MSDKFKSYHRVWQSWQSRGSCIWRRQGRRRHRAQRPVDQHIHLEETMTKGEGGEGEEFFFLHANFSYIITTTRHPIEGAGWYYVYCNDSSVYCLSHAKWPIWKTFPFQDALPLYIPLTSTLRCQIGGPPPTGQAFYF